MQVFKLNQISDHDLEELMAWDHQFFPKPWSRASWHDAKAASHYWGLINHWGFILFSNQEDVLHLLKILVLPTYRGQGYGKKLFEEALQRPQVLQMAKVFLDVESENAPALGLYHSLGFQICHHHQTRRMITMERRVK